MSNRLRIFYIEFEKYLEKREDDFMVFIREYAIIQFDIFIETRNSLVKNYFSENDKVIDECLASLWQPIIKYKNAIKVLRDSYLAHIQNNKHPFKNHVYHIYNQYKFPLGVSDFLYFSKCIILYQKYLHESMSKEYKDLQLKYDSKKPKFTYHEQVPKNHHREWITKADQEAREKLRLLSINNSTI